MTNILFTIGALVATLLIGMLLLTLLYKPFRIWPTPGTGSWQNYVWWPLFRGLNVLCFAVALVDGSTFHGLPSWVRVIAFACLAASLALFLYSFLFLGRDNSYGAQDGLVTEGIYRWTRNPQNAMLIVVYGSLAIADDGARTYSLCAAMIAVYFLMVLAEEPWLEATYGDAYRRYCARVPRFYNFRRIAVFARVVSRKWRRSA
jgi:protein-S-isoprenylcysteine O-methyltransferase Ste14